MQKLQQLKESITEILSIENFTERVNLLNEIREHIHELSPFKQEPVDYVKWILTDEIVANDYNPNKVAPPEMELLEISDKKANKLPKILK